MYNQEHDNPSRRGPHQDNQGVDNLTPPPQDDDHLQAKEELRRHEEYGRLYGDPNARANLARRPPRHWGPRPNAVPIHPERTNLYDGSADLDGFACFT